MAKDRKHDTGSWGLTTWLIAILLVIGIVAGVRYAWPRLRPLFGGLDSGLGAQVSLRLNRDGRFVSNGSPLGVELALAGDVPAFQITGVDEPFLAVRLCPPDQVGAGCETLLQGPTPGRAAWMGSQTRLLPGTYQLELTACPGQGELGQALAAPGALPAGCRADRLELDVRP